MHSLFPMSMSLTGSGGARAGSYGTLKPPLDVTDEVFGKLPFSETRLETVAKRR